MKVYSRTDELMMKVIQGGQCIMPNVFAIEYPTEEVEIYYRQKSVLKTTCKREILLTSNTNIKGVTDNLT